LIYKFEQNDKIHGSLMSTFTYDEYM